MKDLNRNEVYDLRGITLEQAKELLHWLINSESKWDIDDLYLLTANGSLFFNSIKGWMIHDKEIPTTNISTLFEEPSYAVQLIEAVKRVEELKRKINEPKVGYWMFLKGSGFKIVQHEKQASGLKNQGWKKVTNPITVDMLNRYGAN